jgi:adenosylcobinamide-GDP ribazoletransferase
MRAAVSFLTPFGGARRPGPRTLDWFPLVGAIMGLALGGAWWAAGRAWPAAVAAALVVAADLALTGMLHFDGLVDSADGLLPTVDRQRRLAVMADPRAGAFGVAAGGVVLLTRWVALASVRPAVLLLGGLWCLSRTAMAVVARTQPYARDGDAGGLASAFAAAPAAAPSRQLGPLIAGGAVALGLLLWWRPGAGAAAAGAAIVAVAAVLLLARRRIGGFTGDVLGACGVLAETVGLVVAAAKW